MNEIPLETRVQFLTARLNVARSLLKLNSYLSVRTRTFELPAGRPEQTRQEVKEINEVYELLKLVDKHLDIVAIAIPEINKL